MTVKQNKIIVFFVIVLSALAGSVNAQILENSLFKIYRASFIVGTVTQLRFDSDSTYKLEIVEFHCSLCDHDELRNLIDKTGKWIQNNDTIIIDNTMKYLVLQDTIIRPLYLIGIDTINFTDEVKKKIKENIVDNNLNDFHLVYDTYPDGIARLIVDRYRNRREEYEIELKPSGAIKKLRYYWDNKERKRMK